MQSVGCAFAATDRVRHRNRTAAAVCWHQTPVRASCLTGRQSRPKATMLRERRIRMRTAPPNVRLTFGPAALKGTGLPYDRSRSLWRQRVRQLPLEFLNVGNPFHRRRPSQAESRVTEDRARPSTDGRGRLPISIYGAGPDHFEWPVFGEQLGILAASSRP